jgi:hypothetical protein
MFIWKLFLRFYDIQRIHLTHKHYGQIVNKEGKINHD